MKKGKEEETVKVLLERHFWLSDLDLNTSYQVQTDDSDGREDYGWLMVAFSVDGDAWITTYGDDCRFRTPGGGGHSHRVRNALMILAEAIKLDNEEKQKA